MRCDGGGTLRFGVETGHSVVPNWNEGPGGWGDPSKSDLAVDDNLIHVPIMTRLVPKFATLHQIFHSGALAQDEGVGNWLLTNVIADEF